MARINLTDAKIRALRPASPGKRYEVLDALVPGLIVRISDKGKHSLMLKTRFPHSAHPVRRLIGEHGTITLDAARETARDWYALIRKGIDPADEQKRLRREQAKARDNTFSAVADEFIAKAVIGRNYARLIEQAEDYRKARPEEQLTRRLALARVIQGSVNKAQPLQRKAAAVIRELDREFISVWADRPITEITSRDIVQALDAAVARGAEYQAHNLLGHVRRLFSWAIGRNVYGLDRSPCDRLRPKDVIGKKALRVRTLTDAELVALWRAAGQLDYPAGPFYRMLLLTGQRKARWSEFDLDKRLWTIPAARMKMSAAHVVPLAEGALRLLAALPRFKRGDHVFTCSFGAEPVRGFSKWKRRLDASMEVELAKARGGDNWEAVKLEPFVVHDIRRTVRTNLSALPVPDLVRELVIAHTKPGLHKVYDQHAYLDEKRHALELWELRLRSIVEPGPDNVVPLHGRKASP